MLQGLTKSEAADFQIDQVSMPLRSEREVAAVCNRKCLLTWLSNEQFQALSRSTSGIAVQVLIWAYVGLVHTDTAINCSLTCECAER